MNTGYADFFFWIRTTTVVKLDTIGWIKEVADDQNGLEANHLGFFPALGDHSAFNMIEAVLYTCIFAYLGADIEHIRVRIVQIGVGLVGFTIKVFKYG